MQKKKFLFILALLLTAVTGAWADEWDAVYTMTQTTSSNWTALSAGSTTGRTLGSADAVTYYYVTSNLSFTNATAGGSGLTILGTVYLYVPEGKTVTCTGANASGQTGGGAGIELAAGNSLYLIGGGTLNATGGKAANGGNGGNGGNGSVRTDGDYDGYKVVGGGGAGGNGGGGAGAGIGSRGGNGGTGGDAIDGDTYYNETNGENGNPGSAGSTASAMGCLYELTSSFHLTATGGSAGTSAGSAGSAGTSHLHYYYTWDNRMACGGGGGGAGGFGGAASNIGTGGPGGGGGGGGAKGSCNEKADGYYEITSGGGNGGQNADGTYAPNGGSTGVNPTYIEAGMVTTNDQLSYWSGLNHGEGNGISSKSGGSGGARGNASVGGSYSTVTVDWSTQEDDWNLVCLRTNSTRADWVHLADGSTKGKTLGAAGTTTYYYTAFDRTFTNSNAGGSGLTILGTVYLYIPSGKQITCTGANATAPTGGGAGIELAAGNTLYLIGSGTLNATGGNAANGSNGGAGGDADLKENYLVQSGAGGKGGDGGGGAGAGIGTHGGNGGAGGAGGAGVSKNLIKANRLSGNIGNNGDNGGTAADMGTLYIYQIPALTTEIHGGRGGTSSDNGGAGGRHALFASHPDGHPWLGTVGGGAGGAGGGFGGAASDIGTGGPGGGGGGGGASGSIQNNNNNTYFLLVGAFGGAPGANADGTPAGAGEETLMVDVNNLAQTNHTNLSELVKGDWGQDGTGNKYGDNRAAGGAGGTAGAASVSGSANAVTVGWPTQGKGIEDAPFIVSSTDDWNEFASYVNSGYAFSGNFVKLGDDIDISTMAGASDANDANSFQGTFDGDNNTLTFNKGTEEFPFTEQYCAPFRHVKNAVIKNLHVDGSIYTSVQNAAGFVGESHGALTITNCRSSVNIHSSKSGDGTHGGFVATLSGSNNVITIDGCVFDGSFATTASTRNCGGFIGWPVYNKPTIKNSLMKPSSVDEGMLNNTFTRVYSTYEPTITNCYYVAAANLPTNQGTQAYAVNDAPANLGNLVQDYDALTAYANGILFDGKYYVAPASISLANAADNSTTISNANGYVANVTLSGRTLYKDGAWNTLCLPFDVDNFSGTPLEGATVKTLESSNFDSSTGMLTLNFTDDENNLTSIVGGKPYIVKWESGEAIANPEFRNVVISNVTNNVETMYADFIGICSPLAIVGEDRSMLYLGSDGTTLYYPNAAMTLNACRAYFRLNGLEAGDPENGVRVFNLNFGEQGTQTVIGHTDITDSTDKADAAWYTINGVKLDAKPNSKGVYIHGGRKVVIK